MYLEEAGRQREGDARHEGVAERVDVAADVVAVQLTLQRGVQSVQWGKERYRVKYIRRSINMDETAHRSIVWQFDLMRDSVISAVISVVI